MYCYEMTRPNEKVHVYSGVFELKSDNKRFILVGEEFFIGFQC